MPRIDKRYIYLAGKIKIGHGATSYRAAVAPLLRKHGIFALDPLRGKYGMTSWKSLSDNEVVVRDLQDIERAHVVLAVMMKCEDTSFGTPCEIMYAWERRIPVILITNERYLAEHFWAKSLCSNIFFVDEVAGQTFDEVLMQAITHICAWYGAHIEEEVYDQPTLAQEKPSSVCKHDVNGLCTFGGVNMTCKDNDGTCPERKS
ncbi:MAG: nucleoside 2-deoxyribosyltransferase [Patescibacteria group bacterium]|jgi:nucleoside 2-deoxyribosyltransferase